MASVINDPSGRKRVAFVDRDGNRKSIRLGKIDSRQADAFMVGFEDLVNASMIGVNMRPSTAAWLANVGDKMHGKLARAGLVASRVSEHVTLTAFMGKFFATLPGKQATKDSYGNVRRNLEEFFGKTKPIRDMSAVDADAWRAWMVEHIDGKAVKRLSAATVSRRVIAARTMWHKALRWSMVTSNPFTGVKAGQQTNEARKHFVSRDIIAKVLAKAPDTEWAAIVALARYGGLRVPSEIFALRWADIDFETSRMTIPSPKTEHHAGGSSRVCPLFAELRPHLETLFREAAAEGTVYVVTKHRGGRNLRTEFRRLLIRTGVVPWPKLFHNLRASRESELMREYDLATVCKWIGNSPAVAAKHYATSVDLSADFAKAAGGTMRSPEVSVIAPQNRSSCVCGHSEEHPAGTLPIQD